jgi:integrase
LPQDTRISTREARYKLPARREPYWKELVPGTAVGYYKGERDVGWFVRQRVNGRYAKQRIGTPDDVQKADGEVVLSYRQAVERATGLQLEARQPLPRNYSEGQTLNTVIDSYFSEHLAGKGSETNARGSIACHVTTSIGLRLVTAIDAAALRQWHRSLADKPPARRRPEPKATRRGKSEADPALAYDMADPSHVRARRSTANRVLSIVKAALNFAWEHEQLPADLPAYWMKVAPFALGEDPPPRMLEREEITRLLNAASEDLRTLLTGALMTGARYGDLCRLQVRDYIANQGLVRVAQSKTGKTLLQPLTPEGVALFNRLTADRKMTDLVFTRADGSAWAKDYVRRPMAAAVEAAQLVDVSFKTTRATYGKLLLLATRDLEIVAKALGHSDSRVTRKHYAQYLPSEVATAVAKLPALGIEPTKITRQTGKRARKAA